MIKRLTKHGNSLALIIDKPILDLLGIDAETPLEIKTDGTRLTVTPVQDEKSREAVEKAWNVVRRRYAKVFKRLAE